MFNRSFKKSIAVCLSVLALSTACCRPARAVTHDEKMEIARKVLVVGIPILLITGGLLLVERADKGFVKIPVTPIDVEKMTDLQVAVYLNRQISKFESTGYKKIFAISEYVKREANPRILALILKGLNEIFSQYPALVRRVECCGEFKIGFINENNEGYRMSLNYPMYNEGAWLEPRGRGISFAKGMLCGKYEDMINKQKSRAMSQDIGTPIEAFVAREMGLYIFHNIRLNNDLKGAIVGLAKSQNPNLNNADINGMGNIANIFWFAEVFAHSMYGRGSTDISEAMQKYLYKNL